MPKRTATKYQILDRKDPVLRRVAAPVRESEFGKAKLATEIEAMKAALHREDDGVAIAAPQIGLDRRIFVVSGKTLAAIRRGAIEDKDDTEAYEDEVFINPTIIKLSRKKSWMEEGCLSVRWLYGKVLRSEKARIRAFNLEGHPFSVDASGLLAQIFQHEIDHLDGVLFIDKAVEVEDMPPHHDSSKD